MHLSTIVAKCLPALLLPALLLAATNAHAAVSVSGGFVSTKTATTVGYDFKIGQSGTTVIGGVTRATSVQLTCSVDKVAQSLHCDGTVTLQAATAPIRMDYANGQAEWSISSSASTALGSTHQDWGGHILPELGDPPGWNHIHFFDGINWRKWYYSESWANTYTALTGLQYGDIYTI
jgi:hypothetical protein